ncbi:MAG: hypothetical protein LBC44_01390 [Mycoplasmataceae bacterium]|nr:hypothetical protein [Mycoplasmataceae bacterium]
MSDKEINEIEFVEIVDGVKRVSFLTEKQLLNKLFIYRESPDKYLELRLEEQSPTFYVNSKELYVALNEFLKKGNLSGMYIYGQVAVGKTFLISSFLNSYLLKYHPTVSYIDMTKLWKKEKDTWGTGDDTDYDAVFLNPDILILDEFGANISNDKTLISNMYIQKIIPYIKERNAENKITIYISNYRINEVSSRIGNVDTVAGQSLQFRLMESVTTKDKKVNFFEMTK